MSHQMKVIPCGHVLMDWSVLVSSMASTTLIPPLVWNISYIHKCQPDIGTRITIIPPDLFYQPFKKSWTYSIREVLTWGSFMFSTKILRIVWNWWTIFFSHQNHWGMSIFSKLLPICLKCRFLQLEPAIFTTDNLCVLLYFSTICPQRFS